MWYLIGGNVVTLAVTAILIWRLRVLRARLAEWKVIVQTYRAERDLYKVRYEGAKHALANQLELSKLKEEVKVEKVDDTISTDDLLNRLSDPTTD